MQTKIFNLSIQVLLLLTLMACKNGNKTSDISNGVKGRDSQIVDTTPRVVTTSTDTMDIAAKFTASGYMGDGELGDRFIKFEPTNENPFSGPSSIKIQYLPGSIRWGGVYWQNKPNNWGDKPGENYSSKNYTAIKFYARGEEGGEVIEFKAGGIDAKGKQYKDSFESTLGKITLEKNWKQYSINLKGLDLSSVIGGFCWVASANDNPKGVTFFLDDIRIE